MTRRAVVLAALAASFPPVPAPEAGSSVPVARVGGRLAGGRLAGDDVLRRIAATLARITSNHTGALAGRNAGKAFLPLLPSTDLPAAEHVADTMLAAVGTLDVAHGGAPLRRLTATALAPSRQTTTAAAATTYAQDLIRRASTAAYIAKAMGRARVVADEPVLAPPPEPPRC